MDFARAHTYFTPAYTSQGNLWKSLRAWRGAYLHWRKGGLKFNGQVGSQGKVDSMYRNHHSEWTKILLADVSSYVYPVPRVGSAAGLDLRFAIAQVKVIWSLPQNPADIDEFPNQEYSSTFERYAIMFSGRVALRIQLMLLPSKINSLVFPISSRDEEEEAQKAIGEVGFTGTLPGLAQNCQFWWSFSFGNHNVGVVQGCSPVLWVNSSIKI